MDLNKVMLIWRITNDLIVKKWNSNNSILNFSIATNYRYKNKEWGVVEETEFHRCICFWVQADNLVKYSWKWKKIYIEWRLKTRKWEDTNWNTRTSTEIIIDNYIFLENKWFWNEWEDSSAQNNQSNKNINDSQDEDLPF